MGKRIISAGRLLLVLSLLCLGPFLCQASAQKRDPGSELVPSSDPAYKDAAFLNSHGLLQGCPEDYFNGKRLLTGYEFTMFVDRLLKDLKIGLMEIPEIFPGTYFSPVCGVNREELGVLKRLYAEFDSQVDRLGSDSKSCNLFLSRLEEIVALSSKISLADLPDYYWSSKYRVDPYLRAAITLQAMGKEKACETLLTLAWPSGFFRGTSLYVLCRMLFTARGASKFRRPWIGAPSYVSAADWPLEPIEIVDGVPFVITYRYELGGAPEQPSQYIKYCMKNCDWNKMRFQMKSPAEKQQALKKLLASSKFDQRTDGDRAFLAQQIEETKK